MLRNAFLLLTLLSVPAISPLWAQSSAVQLKKESRNSDLKILVISDLNDSYGSSTYSAEVHDVVSKIDAIQPDLILCGGDMVAGQKRALTRGDLQNMWAGFNQTVLAPIYQKKVPFGFTMGNHDASPGFVLDRQEASAFWLAHKEQVQLTFVDDSHYPYYFSYLKNNVFIMSWDASSSTIPAEVKAWMAEQLQGERALQARYRIVLGHLPLYAIVEAKNKAGEVLEAADETLDFLDKHQVDLYISGHQHAYFPGKKQGVTLLNSGCLGGGPRALIGHEHAPYKAYAVLEIPKKIKSRKPVAFYGIKAADHQYISPASLPKEVSGFNGLLQRYDLVD